MPGSASGGRIFIQPDGHREGRERFYVNLLTIDNREMSGLETMYIARIEALRRRVAELEANQMSLHETIRELVHRIGVEGL